MHFSSANDASGRDQGPLKKKQPYTPPKATVLTPDQAEEQLKAKAAALSQEFEASTELIADARRRQELAEGREAVKPHRAEIA